MEQLSLENVLDDDAMREFLSGDSGGADTTVADDVKEEQEEPVDGGALFSDGAKGDDDGAGDSEETGVPSDGDSDSKGLYGNLTSWLAEDGVLDVDDEEIGKVKTADDFKALLERAVTSRLDERQRRIDEALNAGVEPTEAQRYERVVTYLDNLTDQVIESEDAKGEEIRKSLIYQDYINRGFSKERAEKAVERSLKAGTDVDDAKEALQGARDYYGKAYKKAVDDAKAESDKRRDEAKRQAEELRKSIMDNELAYGEVTLDKATRRKIYDNIMKPSYKDPDTGEVMTAIERYSAEHRVDFLRNVGLLFTLTDGFKNLDALVRDKVRKERNKGIKELEKTISGMSRDRDGKLSYASGTSRDPESRFVKWDVAL